MPHKPTEKMLRWLNTVRRWPGSVRHSRTGYICMQRGWTEWNYRAKSGALGDLTVAAARQAFGDQYWDHVDIAGERITEEGLRVLRAAGERQPVFKIAI